MNLRRLASIVIKEVRQFRRDKDLLGLFLAAPVIQLFFFGYAVSTDLKGAKLGIILEDNRPEARSLIQAVEQTRAFELTAVSSSPADAGKWLDNGVVSVVLHIPPRFGATLARGETPVVQVLSDGSDANTATLAYQYLSGAAMAWAASERIERFALQPQHAMRFAGVSQVELQARYWYNPDLRSVNYMIPGVLTVILLAVVMSHTALMVVKEREVGTLEQISVTPIRPSELLVGKTIPPAVLGLAMGLVITFIAQFWFKVPLKGSLLFLTFCAALYLLNTMGLGLLVSVSARTQLQAQLTTNILLSPLILLSGFLFPIANMPIWAQWLTYLMPTRHYMEIVRGVFLKGQGFVELWPQALTLAVLGTLLYVWGILSFRKRVD
jgi:ABC-2 type transport system permease protein